MGSCRGETQDKRPKTARRSPPCPPELLFLTSARPTLRTSRRRRSTDTSCSTSGRRRRVQVWPLRLRVRAPVSGHHRVEQEAEALLDGLVPGQCQDQEEDVVLVLLRRPQEVLGWSA